MIISIEANRWKTTDISDITTNLVRVDIDSTSDLNTFASANILYHTNTNWTKTNLNNTNWT